MSSVLEGLVSTDDSPEERRRAVTRRHLPYALAYAHYVAERMREDPVAAREAVQRTANGREVVLFLKKILGYDTPTEKSQLPHL